MNRRYLLPLTLCLVLCCCSKQNHTHPFSHVDAQKMSKHDIEYVINYPAFVQGVVDYEVIPRISGAIYKKFYTEGTYVKKGQPLYQIDPRPFEWELKAFEGQLIKEEAARDNYKIIYERYQKLYADKAVSKQDLELERIKYYAALGNVQTIEADIGRTKLSLKYCLVRSPAEGYIAERMVTVGTMVTAFETVLNKINSVNQMYLLFSMPENQRLDIEDGVLSSSIKIPDKATFPIDIELANGRILEKAGYVEFTDTRISLVNGAWNMRAYVNNESLRNKLLAGQYTTVYIRDIVYLDIFSLPQEAVMFDDKGHYVYVVQNDKAVRRYVKPGKMFDETHWMIEDGLKKGELVITKGNTRIDANQKVILDHIEEA